MKNNPCLLLRCVMPLTVTLAMACQVILSKNWTVTSRFAMSSGHRLLRGPVPGSHNGRLDLLIIRNYIAYICRPWSSTLDF